MSDSLYITGTETRSGKSLIGLGIMEMLHRKTKRIGYFRPIIKGKNGGKAPDHNISLISSVFNLKTPYEKMYAFTTQEISRLLSMGKEGDAIEGIINKYNELKLENDFILCEGTDYAGSTAAFELDINAEISKNLGCGVLLVANAYMKSAGECIQNIDLAMDSLRGRGCQVLATIVNRIESNKIQEITEILKKSALDAEQLIYTIPYEAALDKPTVKEVADALGAKVLFGQRQLHRHVYGFTIAAMQLRNFLTRIERGSLIITPGDRADIIVACLAALSSGSMGNIAGILLTGGLLPEEPIRKLIEGFRDIVPILSVEENTYPTATAVEKIHGILSPDNERKITRALAVFEKNVNIEELGRKVVTTRTTVVTPKMFEYELIQRARADRRHIVLPEGEEERILSAAETLLHRGVATITLLGREGVIREKIFRLGLNMEKVNIVDPLNSEHFEMYVKTYFSLRRHKGITEENARDVMSDVNFFGTMMILQGHADGMVSGAVHSTAATVRPALEFVKTKPGFSIVSSVFFMCLADRVLVYGDCAVNPNPDAVQLSEIAVSSAHTARTFGITPVIAMLSYSTGESGKGEDVEKVRRATELARELANRSYPGLKIEGPIQYDAAVDAGVAQTKLPGSEAAGRATVFIFPDLNTGNNTYKAVQRSAGAVAVGPVLQGLKRPVNDLSRGCTIPDIVNTVAITAIQAQSEKRLS